MVRASNRDRIIEAGMGTIFRLGFAGAGVRDITADAGVPLGSFTNHFRSKEEFGVEVVERYFAHIEGVIDRTLGDDGLRPLARIRAYLDAITDQLDQAEWRYGCLVGNLSLEVAEHSEAIRTRLSDIFERWKAPFAAVVREAQEAGQLRVGLDADDLAEFLLAGWHGAILRMKVERSPEPLRRFRRVVENTVLAPAPVDSKGSG